MTSESTKKTPIIFAGILIILMLAAFLAWASTQPQALEDVKELKITVAHSEDFIQALEYLHSNEEAEARDPFVLELETTAKTLLEALEPYSLLEVLEEADSDDKVKSVIHCADGEYINAYQGSAWYCYRNGELLEESLFDLPIKDGDTFYFYIASE